MKSLQERIEAAFSMFNFIPVNPDEAEDEDRNPIHLDMVSDDAKPILFRQSDCTDTSVAVWLNGQDGPELEVWHGSHPIFDLRGDMARCDEPYDIIDKRGKTLVTSKACTCVMYLLGYNTELLDNNHSLRQTSHEKLHHALNFKEKFAREYWPQSWRDGSKI